MIYRKEDRALQNILADIEKRLDSISVQVKWEEILNKPSTFPPSPHTHGRDNIINFWTSPFWDNIPDKPSTYPPSSHTHTRSDITDFWSSPFWNNIPDKPSTYPPSSHTHGRSDIADFWNSPFWNNIPDKPSTYPPSSHTHGRSDITNFWNSPFWNNIPDKPSTYPPSSHTHTRSEISNFWATPFWNNIPDKGNLGIQIGSNAYIGTLDNYALSLRTNNTDRIFITNTGNVGIGTTTPSAVLEVIGNARITQQVLIGFGRFTNSVPIYVTTLTPTLQGSDVELFFPCRFGGIHLPSVVRGNQNLFLKANTRYNITATLGDGSPLNIADAHDERLDTAVAIPINKLPVTITWEHPTSWFEWTDVLMLVLLGWRGEAGTTYAGGALHAWKLEVYNFEAGTWLTVIDKSGVIEYFPLYIPLYRQTSPTEYIRISKIRLTISSATGASWDNANLRLTEIKLVRTRGNPPWDSVSALSQAGGTIFGNLGIQAKANAFIGTLDNYALSLRTNNTDRIYITNTGNVGIGTTSPDRTLKVQGTGYFVNAGEIIDLHSRSDSTLDIIQASESTKRALSIHSFGTGQLMEVFYFDGANWLNRFTITKSGNVGIGTSNPIHRLHVRGGGVRAYWEMPYDYSGEPPFHFQTKALNGNQNGWNTFLITADRYGSNFSWAWHGMAVNVVDNTSFNQPGPNDPNYGRCGALCYYGQMIAMNQKPSSGTSYPDIWGIHQRVIFDQNFGGGSGSGNIRPRMVVGIASQVEVYNHNWGQIPPQGCIRVFDGSYDVGVNGIKATELLYLRIGYTTPSRYGYSGAIAGIRIQDMVNDPSWYTACPKHLFIDTIASNGTFHRLYYGFFPNDPNPYAAITYEQMNVAWRPICIGHPVAGNVGIRNTSPSVALDVNGYVRADGYYEYSPMFIGEAISKIRKIKHKKGSEKPNGWAEVDHETLPEEVKVKIKEVWVKNKKTGEEAKLGIIKREEWNGEDFERYEKEIAGRNLGNLVQLILKAVQELDERLLKLENKIKEV